MYNNVFGQSLLGSSSLFWSKVSLYVNFLIISIIFWSAYLHYNIQTMVNTFYWCVISKNP